MIKRTTITASGSSRRTGNRRVSAATGVGFGSGYMDMITVRRWHRGRGRACLVLYTSMHGGDVRHCHLSVVHGPVERSRLDPCSPDRARIDEQGQPPL